MGLTKPYQLKTPEGESIAANLADCINIRRTPKVRDQILAGTFHRISPGAGKNAVTVEKPFFYCDFDRHQFFLVRPRQERHKWKEASGQLERMIQHLPEHVSAKDKRNLRVVYGLGELQEKLVASDAGYDDRLVELMKVYLFYEHPFLLKQVRLRVMLQAVTDEAVEFYAGYDHNPRRYKIKLPLAVAGNILKQKTALKKWVSSNHKNESLFAEKDNYWINFWRWSPSNETLKRLKEYAAMARNKEEIPVTAKAFTTMLKYLPRGSQLSNWAKKDLHDLYIWAKNKKLGKLQDTLFEIRFDRELEDDWHLNDDPDDIDTLWKLLQALPEANVEGNTALREIFLSEGESGGIYDPNSHDIYIGDGELHNQEGFEDVVRHEVGHAVHEMNDHIVTPWLAKTFGWQAFDTTDLGINAWVEQMGGYGKITDQQKKDIRNYLRQCVGIGQESSWSPPAMPSAPAGHPWRAPKFGPRLAAENTGADWYEKNNKWYRKNGRAFFLNYWYQQLMIVNEDTLKLINTGMPDKYAAMSPFEFFAELYALYYDADDPMRKNIPKPVMQWLEKNIGAMRTEPEVRPIARSKMMRPMGKKKR
jgi:CpXC protein